MAPVPRNRDAEVPRHDPVERQVVHHVLALVPSDDVLYDAGPAVERNRPAVAPVTDLRETRTIRVVVEPGRLGVVRDLFLGGQPPHQLGGVVHAVDEVRLRTVEWKSLAYRLQLRLRGHRASSYDSIHILS